MNKRNAKEDARKLLNTPHKVKFSNEELETNVTDGIGRDDIRERLLEIARDDTEAFKTLIKEGEIHKENTRDDWEQVNELLKNDAEYEEQFVDEMIKYFEKEKHEYDINHDYGYGDDDDGHSM